MRALNGHREEIIEKLHELFQRVLERFQVSGQWIMLIAAAVVGVVSGVGAAIFWYGIIGLQKLFVMLAKAYSDPSPALTVTIQSIADFPIWLKIAVPAGSGLIIGPMIYFFAREAKGHGVPEVMDAVATKGGVIRPRVALVKMAASAFSIASGFSLGREGPFVQIGSTFGSIIGQIMRLGPEKMRLLIGCGAAGGIAATFNTPIAGMFFAMEIILGDFAVGAMSALAVSSVVATIVSYAFLGDTPAFTIPGDFVLVSPWEILTYTVLGLLAGVTAVIYMKVLYAFEDIFDDYIPIPDWLKPVLGGAIIGVIGIWLPGVFGIGYDTIDAMFLGKLSMGFMAFLVIAKIVATSVSIGSGASGGIFAPSLFIGSALGGSFGMLAQHWLSAEHIAPAGAYAVVGMAGVVAAGTHAPLTAILIVFEMTGGYKVILPLMLTCAIATIVARFLSKDSIYTLKLTRRGVVIAGGREEAILSSLTVADIMHTDYETIRRNEPFPHIVDKILHKDQSEFYVVDNQNRLVGRLNIFLIKDILKETGLGSLVVADDVMAPIHYILTPEMSLADCLRQLTFKGIDELPVVDNLKDARMIGVLERSHIISTYNREILRQSAAGFRVVQTRHEGKHLSSVQLQLGFETREIRVAGELAGKTLRSLDLRAKYGINCLAVNNPAIGAADDTVIPEPGMNLQEGDVMICVGSAEQFEQFSEDFGL